MPKQDGTSSRMRGSLERFANHRRSRLVCLPQWAPVRPIRGRYTGLPLGLYSRILHRDRHALHLSLARRPQRSGRLRDGSGAGRHIFLPALADGVCEKTRAGRINRRETDRDFGGLLTMSNGIYQTASGKCCRPCPCPCLGARSAEPELRE